MENLSNVPAPRPEPREVSRRDRVSLRAKVQDAVHHFTMLRREEAHARFVRENGRPPTAMELDELQPLVEEFDPVVELALIGADYRNETSLRRQALAEAAQYLRPKLSAVAVMDDPENLTEQAQKNELVKRLMSMMELMTQVKRTGVPDSAT